MKTSTAEISEWNRIHCTAFEDSKCIGSGELTSVALKAKEAIDRRAHAAILIFDDLTSELIEVDFRGTPENVLERLSEKTSRGSLAAGSADSAAETARGPGRPKLGVVGREVTLLPRHWDWLNSQPGGASVALRKLVEAAKRANYGKDRARQSLEATYRFMSAMAGDEPGFEEATRALFAGNRECFGELVESWPVDVRNHAKKLASVAFQDRSAAPKSNRPHPAQSSHLAKLRRA